MALSSSKFRQLLVNEICNGGRGVILRNEDAQNKKSSYVK